MRPQSQLNEEDSENENDLSFNAKDTRRTIQVSPTYNDVIKSQIKRKIS